MKLSRPRLVMLARWLAVAIVTSVVPAPPTAPAGPPLEPRPALAAAIGTEYPPSQSQAAGARRGKRHGKRSGRSNPAPIQSPPSQVQQVVAQAEPSAQLSTRSVTVNLGPRSLQTVALQEEIAPDGRPMRTGSLLVSFRREAPEASRLAAHQTVGALGVSQLLLSDTVRVQVRPGAAAQALIAYRARADVKRAEPDYIVRAAQSPNDQYLGEQYGLAKISAPAAWDRTRGAASVRIAVLDCGIFSGSSRRAGPDGLAGHADLRTKIVAEQNFSTSPYWTDDICNHGTAVAGVAAASTNNSIGMAGVGYDTTIMNVKVLDDEGAGTTEWLSNGIRWAANNGANVINMSMWSHQSSPPPCPSEVQDAVDYAWGHGLVIVAAAGNAGVAGSDWPGNCNHVLAVGATDQSDGRGFFFGGSASSNYGWNVPLAAPGVAILSTDAYGGYTQRDGTSFASPHVAGLAALLWATSAGTDKQRVADRIASSADAIEGTGTLWGYGRINAAAAVDVPSCSPRPPVAVSTLPGEPGQLRVTVVAGGDWLVRLAFSGLANAVVDAGSQTGATASFTAAMPPRTRQTTFIVRRAAAGLPTTVQLVVVDGCGDWPTLVGGGPTSF